MGNGTNDAFPNVTETLDIAHHGSTNNMAPLFVISAPQRLSVADKVRNYSGVYFVCIQYRSICLINSLRDMHSMRIKYNPLYGSN